MENPKRAIRRINPIRLARINCGLTLEEVGEAVGVTKQAVSAWERGTRIPKTKLLEKLAHILNTTMEALL